MCEEHKCKNRHPLFVLLLCLAVCWVQAGEVMQGEASYYADSLQGNKTASGEPYDRDALTAAHRTLAFGTLVRVTYLKNGKSVEVRINDRGPYADDRLIDLSGAAAEQIGLVDAGHGEVRVEVISGE